jgi:hypothetical protein
MARPDHEGPGALRQLVVGIQPPEDDAVEYLVHGFNEGISKSRLATRPPGLERRQSIDMPSCG